MQFNTNNPFIIAHTANNPQNCQYQSEIGCQKVFINHQKNTSIQTGKKSQGRKQSTANIFIQKQRALQKGNYKQETAWEKYSLFQLIRFLPNIKIKASFIQQTQNIVPHFNLQQIRQPFIPLFVYKYENAKLIKKSLLKKQQLQRKYIEQNIHQVCQYDQQIQKYLQLFPKYCQICKKQIQLNYHKHIFSTEHMEKSRRSKGSKYIKQLVGRYQNMYDIKRQRATYQRQGQLAPYKRKSL